MLAEVAAVDTHTRMAVIPCAARRGPSATTASRGTLGIVGIDQEDEALRMRAGEMLEGEGLGIMRLDKGMGRRAIDGDAEFERGRYRCRAAEPGDVAGASRERPASAPCARLRP